MWAPALASAVVLQLVTAVAAVSVPVNLYTDVACVTASNSTPATSFSIDDCIVTPGLVSLHYGVVACAGGGTAKPVLYTDTGCANVLSSLNWYQTGDDFRCHSVYTQNSIAAVMMNCKFDPDSDDPLDVPTATTTVVVGPVATGSTAAPTGAASSSPSGSGNGNTNSIGNAWNNLSGSTRIGIIVGAAAFVTLLLVCCLWTRFRGARRRAYAHPTVPSQSDAYLQSIQPPKWPNVTTTTMPSQSLSPPPGWGYPGYGPPGSYPPSQGPPSSWGGTGSGMSHPQQSSQHLQPYRQEPWRTSMSGVSYPQQDVEQGASSAMSQVPENEDWPPSQPQPTPATWPQIYNHITESAAAHARSHRRDARSLTGRSALAVPPLALDSIGEAVVRDPTDDSLVTYQDKLGVAGELYIYQMLRNLGLRNFSVYNWESTKRNLFGNFLHDESPDEYTRVGPRRFEGKADFNYVDADGTFTRFLQQNGVQLSGSRNPDPPRYFIEVKTTERDSSWQFHMSSTQRRNAENIVANHRSENETYLIFRLYQLGQGSETGLHIYNYENAERELSFEPGDGDGFRVRPQPTRLNSRL